MAFFLHIALLCSVLAEFQIGRRSIVREHRTYSHASVDALGAIDLMGVSDAVAADFPTAMDIRSARPLRLQKEM
jgi:hypothetical protein